MSDWMWDHLLIPFVTRVSGWGVAVAGLLLYLGLGLLLPLYLDWSTSWLVSMNLIGVTFAAVVSLGWLFVQLEAKDRRHLVEWTTNLRLLSAEEFEWMVGELFRREGWNVREMGRHDGPDGNIDLELRKGTERRIVQCKRWTSWQVGVNDVRGFAGALLREGLPGTQGIFVTLSMFTEQARQEAKKAGIAIVDGPDLYSRVERARRSDPCPICQSPMVLGRSEHGWWFRCIAPSCSGKRNLGNEPGRAVDLMTQPPALPGLRQGKD